MTPAKTVATPDGRKLAYLEVGDPQGPLVIHNHGGPSSRLEAALFASAALLHRLRFVCVDRPGMGQSTPQASRSYAGWAQDMVTVADALGHREFGVTGWSEGGPWALAAAAYIDPARLRHVSSIAGGSYGAFGDNSAKRFLSSADALGGFLALHFEPGFRLMYASIELTVDHFGASYIKALLNAVNDYDRKILEQPACARVLCEAGAECFAQGVSGLIADSELLYRRWAFDVSEIERPVHMWQGLDDRLVPDAINHEVAQRMPGAIWHPVPSAGHFVAVGEANEILSVAAAELGKPPSR
ncbi:MAG: alpha/beta hydrolase [Burkholderiales bacterium]